MLKDTQCEQTYVLHNLSLLHLAIDCAELNTACATGSLLRNHKSISNRGIMAHHMEGRVAVDILSIDITPRKNVA